MREQIRLAMLFGEKSFDVNVAHFGQRRGVPARLLILVDEPGAHAFGKSEAAQKLTDMSHSRRNAAFLDKLLPWVICLKIALTEVGEAAR